MNIRDLFGIRRRVPVVVKWRDATSLSLPDLRQVSRAIGSRECRDVFPGTGGFIYLGSNFVAELGPFAAPAPQERVINLALILRTRYFQGVGVPETTDVPALVLGGVPLTLNAADFLAALRNAGARGFSVATESERYTVWWGPLEVEFRSPAPHDPPESAYASAMRYGYQVAATVPAAAPRLEAAHS